jgi:peptidoglycan/LPS O-acetylase OafA/YrhL
MLAVTAVVGMWKGGTDFKELLCEALFIQNYGPNIWNHTWSLAVEEHFYLLLPLFLILLIRKHPRSSDPFRSVVTAGILLALICPLLRLATSHWLAYSFKTHLGATHLRLDSLFFGVVLSYLYNVRRDGWDAICRQPPGRILAVSFLLLLPCIVLPRETHPFTRVAGLTLLYLGYGGLLIFALHPKVRAQPLQSRLFKSAGAALAWAGVFSYSIYLWHMPVIRWGAPLIGAETTLIARSLILFASCLFVGWLMASLIELPLLGLRNRLFPSRSAALQPRAR